MDRYYKATIVFWLSWIAHLLLGIASTYAGFDLTMDEIYLALGASTVLGVITYFVVREETRE